MLETITELAPYLSAITDSIVACIVVVFLLFLGGAGWAVLDYLKKSDERWNGVVSGFVDELKEHREAVSANTKAVETIVREHKDSTKEILREMQNSVMLAALGRRQGDRPDPSKTE